MTTKIRIYRDSGANIRPLDEYKNNIIYYQYPYDSKDRPKKNTPLLSVPSAQQTLHADKNYEISSIKITAIHPRIAFFHPTKLY